MSGIAGAINYYYWNVGNYMEMIYLPLYLLVLAVVYILLQIGKRYLFQRQFWWNWLYYLGLISMMAPTLFANQKNELFFNIVTDFGTLFLFIPLVLDGRQNLIKKK